MNAAALVLWAAATAQGQDPARDVGIDPKLGAVIEPGLALRDEEGRPLTWSAAQSGRPAVLALVYFRCPLLCSEVLQGMTRALRPVPFSAGREFTVLAVSFDPAETAGQAAAARREFLKRYGRPGADAGVRFLTGDAAAIERLTRAAGFRYRYEPATGQFAHAGALLVLTPAGKIARYFYGMEFAPRDVRLALTEAAEERIGSAGDQLLLLCYRYDPATGRYGLAIRALLRIGAVATVLAVAGLVAFLQWRVRRSRLRTSGSMILSPLGWNQEQDFSFFPDQASTMAGRVDALFFYLLAVCVFFSALIFILILVFAVKYRRRSEGESAARVETRLSLELAWTLVPLLLVLVMFFWGARLFVESRRPPADALEIAVVGKQWMWKMLHPGGQREINALHVPAGRPVVLRMASEDVIHSFYIPAFRAKQDVVPGRTSQLWFQASRPGTYHLFCAEYCGTLHSKMIGSVVVLEPRHYERWLAGGAGAESPASAGEQLFARLGCATCHGAEPGARGPALAGLFGSTVRLAGGGEAVADEAYLREAILDPNARLVAGYPALMPTYRGQVSEEGLFHLIAYLKALRKEGEKKP